MEKSPIFIVGCDRSGTTLLRLMLIQSPILHIPQESMFVYLLERDPENYGDLTYPYQRWFLIRDLQTNPATPESFTFPIFNLTLEEAERAIFEVTPTHVSDAIEALFKASASKLNKQRWGDKSPRHVKYIPLLAESFPHAKFVHIIRDGRDVAISIRKAKWVSNNMQEAATYWKQRVKAGRLGGSTLSKDRYYEVYYEQLVYEPEKTLKELCQWLNLDYTAQMLEYYKGAQDRISEQHKSLFQLIDQPIDPSRVSAWKRSLSALEIADFESVAGDLLVELGYEITGLKIPLPVQAIRTLRNNLGPLSYKLRRFFSKI
ncbi:sulfotransferase family protein [Planktothrix agardhii]|jgi:hypothetical protein|uniref:Protein-tyrosine sulfotransferase 1 n=1 Tax=Planktothrix agardhii (strain NIVA-CYA 126/8) TaxID=388467 RepID=A0A073CDT2_PLAA1|nr:sulfotransferase [Planktothrix agardhii]KEI65793.1 Protein-tyrosine sulfotransferase 1 [Planktothrix agardhii NIVA-CYA 126/8]CAD5918919.1 Protein-tyrosine sulfotransferase 1 [Planktothrix agardhii]